MVARERARLRMAIAARGAAAAVGAVALVAAVAALGLGNARWIARPGLPLAVWLLVAALLAALIWWTARALTGGASAQRVAAAIEQERALRDGSLRAALEVADSGALGRLAADALAARLTTASSGRALAPSMQRRALRRGVVAGAGAVAAIALLGGARAHAPDGWNALRHPLMAWTGALLPPLTILDVPPSIMRGERLRLRIAAPARREVDLHLRATGAPWRSQPLAVTAGLASADVGTVDADLVLVATDGRTSSDTVMVHVTDRPFVGDISIRATYPPYLGRAPETIPVGEVVRVPRGTVLSIHGRASTALEMIGLARGTLPGDTTAAAPGATNATRDAPSRVRGATADTLRFAAAGHVFSGRMTAAVSGRYWWVAAGAAGPIPEVPAPLEVDVVPDSVPTIEVQSPESDTVVLADARVSVQVAAADDHGLSAVVLRSWRQTVTGSAQPEIVQALGTPAGPQWSGGTELDLAARGLEPGDELHVRAEATDNSPWRQTASSREVVLRLPSLSEQRAMARALADSAASRAAAAAAAQGALAQETDVAARSRLDRDVAADQRAQSSGSRQSGARNAEDAAPKSLSFQNAERARELARSQQHMEEQVRAVQRDARQLEQQLRAAGALDSTLAQELRDAQQMLQDALTPELQARLQDVMEAAKHLSRGDVQHSLEQLAEQQRRLREELERSAEMLKRAALEGAMQTLHDEAKEIAAREQSVADTLAHPDSGARAQAHAQAQDLAARADSLSRNVDSLAKRLEREHAEAGPRRLGGASRDADRSAEAMREAAGTPRGQDSTAANSAAGDGAKDRASANGARQSATEGARRMDAAAQQLADARQAQISEWKNELTGELDRSIQEMLQMSRAQQALAARARTGEPSEQLRGEQHALQEGVLRVAERLESASRKSAHITPQSKGAVGDARRSVDEAGRQLDDRGGRSASSAPAMDHAAEALNRAAEAMVQDRARAAQSQSASGFAEMLERMREMAKQQGALNGQSAGLLPMPGQPMNAQAAAQARALAAQQRALAARLQREGQRDPSGRADAMAREMRDIASQLERGRVDPALLARQQQVFRRLLDAGLSMEKEEREDTGERESRSATGDQVLVPGGTAHGASTVRFREPTWDELRGLTAEERRAVLEYFKRINAQPAGGSGIGGGGERP